MCTANEAQDIEYAGRLCDGHNPSHFILFLNKLYLNYFNFENSVV